MVRRLGQAGLNPSRAEGAFAIYRLQQYEVRRPLLECFKRIERLQAQVILEPACAYGAGLSCRTTVSDARLIVEL